jgi:hypothetical protein
MTRTMVDSTNVIDDPLGADLVAYYIDGDFATTEASVKARFPNAILVPISAVGTNAGICGDVEPGCMTNAQSVDWILMRRAAGINPSLYVNEVNGWQPCKDEFARRGVPEPAGWWVADYDGINVVPPGAVAKQYANPDIDHGHFDLSVVADFWPGIDPIGENDMVIFHDPVSNKPYLISAGPGGPGPGGLYKSELNLPTLQALQVFGIPMKDINHDTILAIPDFPTASSGGGGSVAGSFSGTIKH